jgi:hypothetical protein
LLTILGSKVNINGRVYIIIQWENYSYEFQILQGKWLHARFEFANHLTIN